MRTRSPRPGGRAQTSIDFVAGMGVFLLAMAFTFMFIPSMFAPFFGVGIGDPITADRSANFLAEDRLAADNAPVGVLSAAENASFFSECDGVDWLRDELGIEGRSVRVSVGGGDCGPEPDGAVTVSQRLVVVDGDYVLLQVEVW